jgi:uncharacterized membrane protein
MGENVNLASVAKMHRSRTNWVGLAIVVTGYLQSNVKLMELLLSPVVSPENAETVMGAITMALGLSVIVLRFFTDTALANK